MPGRHGLIVLGLGVQVNSFRDSKWQSTGQGGFFFFLEASISDTMNHSMSAAVNHKRTERSSALPHMRGLHGE